jgi:hypothetical protein
MNKQDIYLTIIFLLMLTTGFIIYFMYLKEPFFFETTEPALIEPELTETALTETALTEPTLTSNSPTLAPNTTLGTLRSATSGLPESDNSAENTPYCVLPDDAASYRSVLSRYFGVGFNIKYVQQNNNDYYLINHVPTVSTGILGGCYSITKDNLLTIKLQNSADTSQLWKLTSYVDSISAYFSVTPLNNSSFSLQYENGSLSLRPFNSSSIFEGQKWLRSKGTITRGIPVLNNSPASLFTSEFDPYSTPQGPTTLSDQNAQQVNDVIAAVKSGIQQYLGKLDNDNTTEDPQISSSSLGKKGTPLNINLSLSSPSNKISGFANVNNNALSSDMLSTMDRYGPSTSSSGKQLPLYSTNSLENEISKNQGCKLANINDYTSNRVSSCNCKL